MSDSYSFKVSLTFDVINDPNNKEHVKILQDALPKVLIDTFGENLSNVESKLEQAKPIDENGDK